MQMTIPLLAAALVLQIAGAPGRITVEHTTDSLDSIRERVAEEEAVLVDVRTVEEWDRGHVAGAVMLPLDSLRKHSLDREKLADTLPKEKPLYLYCMVGMRSKQATAILRREGYDAHALKPGLDELLAAGFERATGR
jgi:phage shock protein E